MSKSQSQQEPRRILRIIARLNVGGPARHVVWLARGLQNADYTTRLVTGVVPPGEDDMSYFATENNVEPLVMKEMSREISPKDAVTVWKLYRLMKRERPAIVHTHTAKAGTVGRVAGLLYRWLTWRTLAGRPRRCRFVHTYHGHIFHSYYGSLKTRLFLLIEKTLARIATDRIVTISPQQFREIHEKFGVGRAEQFAVVPLGLDTKVFADWRKRRHILRDELRAQPSDVLVGIIGRLTEIKNHRLFLEAIARYKERAGVELRDGGRVRFIVIGDGHLRRELEALQSALGLTDDVIFLGTRVDAENFYPALDAVALTSLNEGTPLTLIEAMANARAVVATNVGGVVDLLGERAGSDFGWGGDEGDEDFQVREHGLLVRPQDAESFSHALDYIIKSKEKRELMGERALKFVERNYSVGRLLADVQNLYAELLGGATASAERAASLTEAKGGITRLAQEARLKGD